MQSRAMKLNSDKLRHDQKCKKMKLSQDMQLIQKLRDDQKRMKKVFEVMSGRNIVTNSRVTPSWREIVSLTFSEAGVLHWCGGCDGGGGGGYRRWWWWFRRDCYAAMVMMQLVEVGGDGDVGVESEGGRDDDDGVQLRWLMVEVVLWWDEDGGDEGDGGVVEMVRFRGWW
ncbi:hypothetical protein Tco_1236022 [Tanacetum coccineum]